MLLLNLILYLIAAICFGLAVFGVVGKVNILAAGLLAWVLVPLITTIRAY